MKKLMIGILLVVLGLPGTAYFFSDFISLVMGGLPLLLILGGGLAVYLGYEELQAKKDLETDIPDAAGPDIPDDAPPTDPPEPEKQDQEMPMEDSSSTPTLPDADSEDAIGPEGDTGFAGNTDTLVFHSISCNFARGKKCTVRFASRDEAVEQGYTPCKVCNP